MDINSELPSVTFLLKHYLPPPAFCAVSQRFAHSFERGFLHAFVMVISIKLNWFRFQCGIWRVGQPQLSLFFSFLFFCTIQLRWIHHHCTRCRWVYVIKLADLIFFLNFLFKLFHVNVLYVRWVCLCVCRSFKLFMKFACVPHLIDNGDLIWTYQILLFIL